MDYFQLSLSSTDNTFAAGQTVEGVIRVGLSQPMAVNAIVVRLTGRGRTSFQKEERIASDKGKTQYETVRYAAEQICLDLSVNVLDAKSCNNLLVPLTQQEFPFSFLLPADLPPSFKGKHGSITYICEAVLHRTEWYKANSVTEKKNITIVPAFVASPMDSIPLKEDVGNEVGWLCCVRGRIFATAMLPAASFSVGELMPNSLDVRNNSSRPIKRLELTLIERSSFVGSKASVRLCNNRDCCGCYRSGHTKTEVHDKVLVRLVEELVVEPYTSTNLLRTLTLPESVVPSFDNCPIVQNRHFVKISLVPDTWIGSNTTTEVPINIRSQAVKRLPSTTHQSGQNGVREPTAPLGTECFANEKSLYPNDLLW